ncbi:MAG: hypothetical protein M3237_16755 [Actinomycetota bacterium]|nr:hypothetical protein [Actinomycetota bacterium]
MVWFHAVPPEVPEIMSAEPSSVKRTSTSQKLDIRPARPMHALYDAAASTIARPWWCLRDARHGVRSMRSARPFAQVTHGDGRTP